MNDHAAREETIPESSIDNCDEDAVITECIDEMDELILTLDRFPPGAVVVALGTYLEGLLGALFDERRCTADEVRRILREIESGVLKSESSAGK